MCLNLLETAWPITPNVDPKIYSDALPDALPCQGVRTGGGQLMM